LHVDVLDSSYVLHSLGAAISEPTAPTLHWHRDSSYPFQGVGGADMPPHAITLLTPMLDITDAHGPTAFCVGSAHLHGVNRHTATLRDGLDASLLNDEACPRGLSVFSPLLKRGDVLLFDYNTMHRAAPNHSPQTRALLYVTFSRNWFKDVGNFDADHSQSVVAAAERNPGKEAQAPLGSSAGTPLEQLSPTERHELERLTKTARFAEPNALDQEAQGATAASPLTPLEDLSNLFSPLAARLIDAGVGEFEDEEEPDDDTCDAEEGGCAEGDTEDETPDWSGEPVRVQACPLARACASAPFAPDYEPVLWQRVK